jgi:lipopolysaccharide export system permease protein
LIGRYILRETFGAWLVVVAVLFMILMTNQFAEILGDAAADRLPRDAVFAIFSLTSLRYVTLLTPIALFLGVMLALARLNRDCEMAALSACGIGPGRLLMPVLTLTVMLAAALTWLSLYLTPSASSRIEEIKLRAEQEMQLGILEAGKFTSPDAGDTVIYSQEVVGDELHDVFVQRQQGDRVVVILAQRGRRVVDAATGEISFVLYDGRRYEGVPGDNEFLVVEFEEHGIPIRPEEPEEDEALVEVVTAKPTAALLGSPRAEDRAELEWRISVPISVLVLALLAVPLSRSSPREGRYARLGIGLLCYIIYANLLAIARVQVEQGAVPDWLGVWWVHAAALAVAAVMLLRQSGLLARSPMVAPEAAT